MYQVGLTPEIACKPELTETSFWNSGQQESTEALLQDPCILLAAELLRK